MADVRSTAKTILLVAGVWLLGAIFAALEFGALVPRSKAGFVGLLVFGPPLYVLGEFFANWLWYTDTALTKPRFSSPFVRIFLGVVFGGILAALLVWWSAERHG